MSKAQVFNLPHPLLPFIYAIFQSCLANIQWKEREREREREVTESTRLHPLNQMQSDLQRQREREKRERRERIWTVRTYISRHSTLDKSHKASHLHGYVYSINASDLVRSACVRLDLLGPNIIWLLT